jgi:hypothetical protein
MRKTITGKITVTAAMLSALLSLSGCITEQMDDCTDEIIIPTRGVNLDFVLNSGEKFGQRIITVDVGIFDGRGNYLRSERASKEQIAVREGMDLALDPGDYRLVFWANMNGSTKFANVDTWMSAKVVHEDRLFDPGGRHVTGQTDPLYYAPFPETSSDPTMTRASEFYPLTVTGKESQRHTVSFTHAYRILDIYIYGLKDMLPSVRIEGLPAGLSYSGMKKLSDNVNQLQKTLPFEREGQKYAAASFRSFRFDEAGEIDIVLLDANGGEFYRIPLDQAIAQSGFDVGQLTIQLLIGFRDGNVEITIPGWERGNIGIDY